MSKEKTAMVSGHTDLTQEKWDKYYKAKIDKLIEEGYAFVVGGAAGADELTQLYLAKFPEVDVTVYDKGTQDNAKCPRFKKVNGFKTYPERDAAMTAASSLDVCVLNQYGGAGSGTAANLYRRKFGDETSKQIIKLIRDNSMEYEK
jgi:hypothetical protein